MKKILMLVVVIFVLEIYSIAGIFEFVPKDSKMIILLSSTGELYGQLKTVHTLSYLLGDPLNVEMLFKSYVDMYLSSLEVESEKFFEGLTKDMVFFISEIEENNYIYGFIVGPVKEAKDFSEVISKAMKALMPEFDWKYEILTSKGDNYVIFCDNIDSYAKLKKGFSPKHTWDKVGIYFEINTSETQGYGRAYVKNGMLFGESISTSPVVKKFEKGLDYENDPFLGTLFIKNKIFEGNPVFESLTQAFYTSQLYNFYDEFVKKSKDILITSGVNVAFDEEGNLSTDVKAGIIAETDLSIDEVLKYISEDVKVDKLPDDVYKLTVETTAVSRDIYVWKEDNKLYVSITDKNKFDEYIKSAKKIKDDELYKELSPKLPKPDISVFFLNLKSIFSNLMGINENLGAYGVRIVEKIENEKVTTKDLFILK